MPLVVHDKVIIGVMGGERGVRGHITAYNINNGSMRWRYYSMGPNNEVGIGPRFKPFYRDDKMPNPALDSWYGDSWKRGGGSIWGWLTFDPDLNLFYYGTSNCGPWNPDYRRKFGEVDLDAQGGLATYRNNYCSSILARDADSGELIWAYNVTPQDGWDLDEPSAGLMVDLQINGRLRKTLVHPARNGFFYVFDRATGEMVQRPHQRRRCGNGPDSLRHPQNHVHKARRPAEVRAGRERHDRYLVSRHRRPKLVSGRFLSAHRSHLHTNLEPVRRSEGSRRQICAWRRLHAA
jgi:glucose dehydrogenase